MSDISFDDLLAEKPKKRTSIKREAPKVKAGRVYTPASNRETKPNWESPEPEAVILFWSETKCDCCGTLYSHPTYMQNSCLVRYRVSRFRSILKPYSKSDEAKLNGLPRMKETSHHTVRHCAACFDDAVEMDEMTMALWLEDATSNSEDEKPISPFIHVDESEAEITEKFFK